jgi:trigger factor
VAGKTAQFTLKVSKVAEGKIPELSEDLVKSFGVKNGNVDDFKKDVRSNMEKELAQKIKTTVKNRVLAGLLDKNEIAAPSALVNDEIKNLKGQMAQNMGQDPSKMDPNSFPDDLFREEGTRRVKLGLLVGELIRLEKIELDRAKFDGALQDMAASYEQPQQVIDYYTKNQDAKASLEGLVLEDQVVDHILEKAKVTEKVSSFDEIMNGPATA